MSLTKEIPEKDVALHFMKKAEENVVFSNLDIDFFEIESDKYCHRYTKPEYFSPFEFFLVNSRQKINISEKMKIVNHFFNTRFIVENNEYTDGYIHIESLEISENHRKILNTLNDIELDLLFYVDILITINSVVYLFIPGKDYLFEYYRYTDNKIVDNINVIFIPVRGAVFWGESGYFDSLICYGKLLYILESLCYSSCIEKSDFPLIIDNTLEFDELERICMDSFKIKNACLREKNEN